MFEIITRILNSALGIVLNKARNNLKDGDVTEERLRVEITEDLNEIKTKIDGLSQMYLHSSMLHFEKGASLLNLLVNNTNDKAKYEENDAQVGGSETTTTATATTQSTTESGVLNEALALSNAIRKLNLNSESKTRIESAKTSFKEAGNNATKAFCNKALTIQDSIMAANLLVASSILESLQDTKAAIISCMLFLEKLHKLPAISEIFSAYFKDRIKAQFCKQNRLEIIKSVLSLNFAVSEFIARFSGELPDVRNWPKINFPTKGGTIHPLVLAPDELKEIFEGEDIQLPENYVRLPNELNEDLGLRLWGINSKGKVLATSTIRSNTDHGLPHWSVNSKGELIATSSSLYLLTFNRLGRREIFSLLPKATANYFGANGQPKALTIDRYDNVYVIILSVRIYVLFVIDSKGYKQCEEELRFVEVKETSAINCAVTNKGDIIIHCSGANHYYVCYSNGTLKSCVPLEHSANYYLRKLECVTNQNEMIMRATKDGTNHVLAYTMEGKLKRQIEVAGSVVQVTYDYVTSQIQVLTIRSYKFSKNGCYVYCYPETDDGCERLYLHKRESQIVERLKGGLVAPVDIFRVLFPSRPQEQTGSFSTLPAALFAPLLALPSAPLPYPMLVSHPHGPTAHLWNDSSENITVILI